MEPVAVLQQLQARFGASVVGGQLDAIDPWIEIRAEGLSAIARHLRDEPTLRFDLLNCITVVDYLELDPKKAATFDYPPHLEVVYHLTSLAHRHQIVLKVMLPRWKNDVPGELPEAPSVADVWPTADWHERELYDLSGVRFVGHPDLRRILCPEDWEGHPLRKDYQTPREYHGIRVK